MALSSGFFKSAKLAAGAAAVVLTLASPALAFHGGGGGGGFHGGGGFQVAAVGGWRRLGRRRLAAGGGWKAAVGAPAGWGGGWGRRAGAADGACRFTVPTLITTTAIMALPSSSAGPVRWSWFSMASTIASGGACMCIRAMAGIGRESATAPAEAKLSGKPALAGRFFNFNRRKAGRRAGATLRLAG